jgi:hypothetical protein
VVPRPIAYNPAVALTVGTIVVADPDAFGGNGGLIAVDPGSGRQTALSQGGLFRDPFGVAIAHDGTIVVSDGSAFDGTGGLISVDPGTGRQTKIAASGIFRRPLGVAVDAGGQVVVAYTESPDPGGAVMRVNPATGEFHAVAPGFAFNNPPAFVALDGAGNVIVSEFSVSGLGSRLLRILTAGQVIVLNENGGNYTGVVVSGAVLAGSSSPGPPTGKGLLRVSLAGGNPVTISQGDKIRSGPFGVDLERGESIVLIDQGNGVIRVDLRTGAQSIVSKGDLFAAPVGVAVLR